MNIRAEEILNKYWGYKSFRPMQKEIIESIVQGKDTLALLPTGGGKSIIYQVAGMMKQGKCIVVTPLISLMKDQVEQLKDVGIGAEYVYSGMSNSEIDSMLNKVIYTDIKFLYVSPERLNTERFREKISLMNIDLVAVDEAHCISQWGYDFRPSYMKITNVREITPEAVFVALTATATPFVCKDIQRKLGFKDENIFSTSFRRSNITYVVRNTEDKIGELIHIVNKMKDKSTIVYVNRRKSAEDIHKILESNGIKSGFYHAGMTNKQRENAQDDWMRNENNVIIATNAFGMGINKSDVRLVIHFDSPDSPEAYFQESGRVGRDGHKSYAVLLHNNNTVKTLRTKITKSFPEISYIKKIYFEIGNYLQIGEGAGEGHAYNFDIYEFVKKLKLDYTQANSAIEILEISGYFDYKRDVFSNSRISFSVPRSFLYDFKTNEPIIEKILEILMRSYPGIFTNYVYINEDDICKSLNINRDRLYDIFIEMSKLKIIKYIPENNNPYIVYNMPRMPMSYVSIPWNVYSERKKSYSEKVTKMINYIQLEKGCRQVFITSYFGDKDTQNCGSCDLCLKQNKHNIADRENNTKKQLINYMKTHRESHIKDVVSELPIEEREYGIEYIRELLDDGIIEYKSETDIGLKE